MIATIVISLIILLMTRFNWYAREMSSQILRIQVPSSAPFDSLFEHAFLKYTNTSELLGVGSVQSGTLTELTYTVGLKKSNQVQDFLTEIRNLNGNHKVTLIAGFNGVDL